jgi:hypothetical protein
MLYAYVNTRDIPLNCSDRISVKSVQEQYKAQEWLQAFIFHSRTSATYMC